MMTQHQESNMTCSKLMVILTVLLPLLMVLPSSDACSCAGQFPPHRLCCRDIVLHGEVQSEKVVGKNISKSYYREEKVYTVRVLYIFKGLEKIKSMSKDHNTSYVEIYTGSPVDSCGMFLPRQQSFVVSGSVDRENRITSYLCEDWQSTWDKVPTSYKEVFPMLRTCKCAANTNYLAPGDDDELSLGYIQLRCQRQLDSKREKFDVWIGLTCTIDSGICCVRRK